MNNKMGRPHFLSVRLSDEEAARYQQLVINFCQAEPFLEETKNQADLFRELIWVLSWMVDKGRVDLSKLPKVLDRLDTGF